MPATCHNHDLPVGALRAVAGLAGILLLMLQLLGPALASPGQGTWMEICSEAGAVWVQVDPDEDTGDPAAPCPKCANCPLCAVIGLAPLPAMPGLAIWEVVQTEAFARTDQYKPHKSTWLWPQTRGPPRGPEKTTERAWRASMASTQVIGGAPWL
ncbi:MAG: DUF2946 family protein [Marinibacterium sp.]